MQKYPGIAVSVTGGFSNVLNEKIERQIADQKLEVDMAFFQTVQDFVTWKTQGKLLAFKPDGFIGSAELSRRGRRFPGAERQRAHLCLQYRQGPRGGCAEIGAGFSQADVCGLGDHRLSG